MRALASFLQTIILKRKKLDLVQNITHILLLSFLCPSNDQIFCRKVFLQYLCAAVVLAGNIFIFLLYI